jgi:hypothetical protein
LHREPLFGLPAKRIPDSVFPELLRERGNLGKVNLRIGLRRYPSQLSLARGCPGAVSRRRVHEFPRSVFGRF